MLLEGYSLRNKVTDVSASNAHISREQLTMSGYSEMLLASRLMSANSVFFSLRELLGIVLFFVGENPTTSQVTHSAHGVLRAPQSFVLDLGARLLLRFGVLFGKS